MRTLVVLAAEDLQYLLTVMAVPPARCGGEPLDLWVEQVDDGVDAVTAGALVGGLEEVKVSAHGTLQRAGAMAHEVVVAASSGLTAWLSASI